MIFTPVHMTVVMIIFQATKGVYLSSDEDGPRLIDDLRYTPESAAYWRSLGMTVHEEHITDEDDTTDELIPNNMRLTSRFNTIPFKSGGFRRWKIRYMFYHETSEEKLDEQMKEKVRAALKEMQKQTCLTFVEIEEEDKDPEGLIRFFDSGNGCHSHLGRIGSNKISLGNGCGHIGIIQHEVMHALGVGHEQGRYDRDKYIEVHLENIKEGKASQFSKTKKQNWNDMETRYDFHSIMQYGGNSFRKTNDGPPTITFRTGDRKGEPVPKMGGKGQINVGMSSMDVYQLCKSYECGKCAGIEIASYEGKAHESYLYECKKFRKVTYPIFIISIKTHQFVYLSVLNSIVTIL